MGEGLEDLKEQIVRSIFRLKHLDAVFHSGMDSPMNHFGISVTELILMKKIEHNNLDSIENIGISDIQKHLYITKAAVSKMLGVLEKKGYILRETNKHNRRMLTITLTREGKDVLDCMSVDLDRILTEMIRLLGKDEIEQFIKSVNGFADAAKSVVV